MRLHAKNIPNFKYHVSAGYKISEGFHRGETELASIGKGNKFSSIFCLIIR